MKHRKHGDEEEKYHRAPRWIGCEVEEEFFGEERKSGKMERKRATAKDRSKYKKTDRQKQQSKETKPLPENLSRGRVLSITPQGIVVEHEGRTITCALRGALKKEKNQLKNLVTVGDWVLFEHAADNEGYIAHVEPRSSILSRADNLSQRKEQLIAANIDQVLITLSVVSPPLKPFLADRYIIAAQKGGMTPIIIINKIDLLNDTEQSQELRDKEALLLSEFLKAYEAAEIKVIAVSAESGEGLDQLREIMQNKASVFSGQSGVGKSSLINYITDFDLPIGPIVEKTQKGTHTTTTANLLPLSFGGWCIDTPGIKSFGVWDLKADDIQPHFAEIHAHGKQCKYQNCTHTHEQDCAVMLAVEEGKISSLRYQSYLFLIESVKSEHLRR